MMRVGHKMMVLLGLFAHMVGFSATELHAIEPDGSCRMEASVENSPQAGQDRIVLKKEGLTPSSTERIVYENGRIVERLRFWNNQPWELTRYEYIDHLSRYSVKTLVYHGEKEYIVRNDLYEMSEDHLSPGQKIETRYFNFDKNSANTLRQVDTYWPGTLLVKERDVYSASGCYQKTAHFEYDLDTQKYEPDAFGNVDALTRMTLVNNDGDIVCDYREKIDINLTSLYFDHALPVDEIARREKISRDSTRTPILVLDGGIDISHPELAYKLWKNPSEIPNGIDDDGNGLADDIYGVSDNPRLAQPVQDLRLPRFGLPPFSHGTLVASIAAQGREDVAIMAASEMTAIHSSELLPRIERLIKSHGVRYTNMSFVFDKQILDYDSGVQRPRQIERLIRNTPGTLHVVAAGNGAPINGKGFDVDELREEGDLVPAMLRDDNILVVGALDTDGLHLPDYPTYKLAPFSNVGALSVDILAPGIRVCGARMGGGTICEDGTSFAAPYVLNHGVLAVAKANPDLNVYEIKEILMKTAYVPDLEHPFPVRSGGILHPRRAVAAARWLADHPADSVEAAVLAVRQREAAPIPGEENNMGYLSALRTLWKHRSIGHTQQWYARAVSDVH